MHIFTKVLLKRFLLNLSTVKTNASAKTRYISNAIKDEIFLKHNFMFHIG